METKKILFISDSRGRDIKPLLNNSSEKPDNIVWEVQVIPGAKLEDILKRVERGRRRNKWDQVVICAGICNVTNRVVKGGRRYLEYKNRQVEEICTQIDHILDDIGIISHICTITPAVIELYSNVRDGDPELQTEQQHLYQDIETINNHIIERNIARDRTTIDLAKLSQIRSKKRQGSERKRIIKFNTKDVRDGVHPTPDLLQRWAHHINSKVRNILNKHEQTEDTETNESGESESESWNFKRPRRK